MSLNLLQNPNFSGGSTANWLLQLGWVVGLAGLPTPGVGYNGIFTGPGESAIRNLTKIPVSQGAVVTANCWALGEPGASGLACLRITFWRADGTFVAPSVDSSYVANNYVWVTRTVSAATPSDPTIAYALIDFAVYQSTSGAARWFCTNFWASAVNQFVITLGLKYYLNLFTSQYRMSAKLNAWQTVLMQPLKDLTTCLQQFNAAYDIDVAVGDQEDVLGEIIGVSRNVPFQPSSGSPVLDDANYRLLLYATQAENSWDGHITSLYTIWEKLFPNGVLNVVDNQNMTATITTSGLFTSIEQDLINHGFIVPRPEGVLYNAAGVAPGTKLFGFDLNTTTVAGFDTGKWA